MDLDGTPWVDRSLKSLLGKLQKRVPESWLPQFGPNNKVIEFGCGHYGCVMPTDADEIVVKLTTDVSEAAFVARAMELDTTVGIVEYKKIFLTDLTHRKRPMFVLWRTEAYDIGKWSYSKTHPNDSNPEYVRRVEKEADKLMGNFLNWGKEVRKYMYPHLRKIGDNEEERAKLLEAAWNSYERMDPVDEMSVARVRYVRGIDRVGMALRTCLHIAQEMQGNPSLYRVGEALAYYLEEGLLLADVHYNNIGVYDGEALISDPGHSVEFHPRWAPLPSIKTL